MKTPTQWFEEFAGDRPEDFGIDDRAKAEAIFARVQADAQDGWTLVTDALPDLERVVELAVVSGFDGSLWRAFGCRADPGEGWLWHLGTYGVPEQAMDCEADDDYQVWAWRSPTPLPPAPPKGWNGSPQAIDPPKPEAP